MNYRRSVGAVLSTAALIAAMSPVAAFAKTSGTGITDVDDVSITVSGLTEGDTATAYQVFDAYIDGNNVLQYKAAENLPKKYDSVDEISGLASNSEDAKAAADAYSKAFADGTAKGVAVTSTKAGSDGKATFSGLDSGYWVVVVTSTSGETKVYQPTVIDVSPTEKDSKWVPNTRAAIEGNKIKSEPVNVSKGVGENYEEKTDKYSVGQLVPFKVTTIVPNYPADSKDATFTIVDTPTAGLEIDTNSIMVTVDGTTVWEKGAATTDGATAFKTTPVPATNGYVFDFARDYVLKHPGKNVVITYNAKLTSAAFSHSDTDVTGNTAQVTFNPNPYSGSTVTPEDKTKVQTYGFVFEKVDQDKNALEGAVFTLYKKVDGKEEVVTGEDGESPITATSTTVTINGVDHAYVSFEDLGDGDYVAKETTVPAGKVKAQDVNFSLNKDVATNDNPATKDVTENNYLVAKDKIVDSNQPLLPVTGEAGTLLITIGGVALIGAACIVVSRSRKRSE
jgi:fimbrial isopeptide formation D2 family protein/LPXTG-motif cell wall-anchored protein